MDDPVVPAESLPGVLPDPAPEDPREAAVAKWIERLTAYPIEEWDDIRDLLRSLDAIDLIRAELAAANARLAAVEALCVDWDDLLATQSEIMTTAQRNAHKNDLAELRAALGGS